MAEKDRQYGQITLRYLAPLALKVEEASGGAISSHQALWRIREEMVLQGQFLAECANLLIGPMFGESDDVGSQAAFLVFIMMLRRSVEPRSFRPTEMMVLDPDNINMERIAADFPDPKTLLMEVYSANVVVKKNDNVVKLDVNVGANQNHKKLNGKNRKKQNNLVHSKLNNTSINLKSLGSVLQEVLPSVGRALEAVEAQSKLVKILDGNLGMEGLSLPLWPPLSTAECHHQAVQLRLLLGTGNDLGSEIQNIYPLLNEAVRDVVCAMDTIAQWVDNLRKEYHRVWKLD